MATTATNYYRVNYSTKFVDHLLSEFQNRFSDENQIGMKLFSILPAHVKTHQPAIDKALDDLLFWESDLCHPSMLRNELREWYQQWKNFEGDVPANLLAALGNCDSDVYPCIHRLLVIGCTLPVTSCEAERSFSALRLTMNHLRCTMGEERLASLMLLHMHQDIEISVMEVVRLFVTQHSRRMFKGSVLFD